MNGKFTKHKKLKLGRRGVGVLKVQNYLWVFGGTYYRYPGYGPGNVPHWISTNNIERINLDKPESEFKVIIDKADILGKFNPENFPNFILRNGQNQILIAGRGNWDMVYLDTKNLTFEEK